MSRQIWGLSWDRHHVFSNCLELDAGGSSHVMSHLMTTQSIIKKFSFIWILSIIRSNKNDFYHSEKSLRGRRFLLSVPHYFRENFMSNLRNRVRCFFQLSINSPQWSTIRGRKKGWASGFALSLLQTCCAAEKPNLGMLTCNCVQRN